jgi:hypothetical protein
MKIQDSGKVISAACAMLLFFAILPIVSSGMGDRGQSETRCLMCGMDAAESETMFVLNLRGERKMYACCLNCADQLMDRLGDDFISMTTSDFGSQEQVEASAAYYVEGSEVIPRGSMFPFLPAFGAREDAEALVKKSGGKILTYEEALELCREHRRKVHRR